MEGDAGTQKLHGVLHDGQDRVVDGALAIGETARDWDATGHVGRVVAVLGADVHQDDVPSLAFVRILDVVEDACIEARPDDGRVREATGAAAQEFVHELRFNFVFHDAGLHELQDAVKARLGDVARALHLVDFPHRTLRPTARML